MALSKEKQLHQETQELRHSEAISTQWWQLHSLRLPMFLLPLLIWCSIERGSVFLPRCRQSLSYPRIASSLSHNATTYRMSVPPWATNLDSVSNSFTFLRQQSLADNRCSCFTRIDANISQNYSKIFKMSTFSKKNKLGLTLPSTAVDNSAESPTAFSASVEKLQVDVEGDKYGICHYFLRRKTVNKHSWHSITGKVERIGLGWNSTSAIRAFPHSKAASGRTVWWRMWETGRARGRKWRRCHKNSP